MTQPFNYMIGGMDPVGAMFDGMAFSQDQRAGEQDMLAGRQQMDLAASQEQRAQTGFEQNKMLFDQGQADRKAAQENAMKVQSDLVGLAGKVSAGTATSTDFAAIAAAHPELADEMSKMWEGQTVERKAADVANIYQAASAIKAGKPQIALDMLEARAVAAEASGDKQEADVARALAAGIKADPSSGLATLGLLLHSVDEKASVDLFGVASADEPADVQTLKFKAKEAGLIPGTDEYKAFMKNGGKPQDGSGGGKVKVNADGSIEVTQGGPAVGLKLTEGEGKATGFMYRMSESDKTISELENEGSSLWNKVAGGVPVLGNYMLSDGAQKFDQAKRDFINAVLRRESGAVISPEEFANGDKQYFPQPGDGAEVIAQKRRNRQVAIEGVRAGAGAGGTTNATPADGSGSQTGDPGAASFDDAFSKYGATP